MPRQEVIGNISGNYYIINIHSRTHIIMISVYQQTRGVSFPEIFYLYKTCILFDRQLTWFKNEVLKCALNLCS